MAAYPSIDRDPLQNLLASAFEIQKSEIRPEVLATILEIQRMIAFAVAGKSRILDLIVQRGRYLYGADGIAVAVLEKETLTYRAGSGTALSYVGQRVPAVLSPADPYKQRREILRVENADCDTGIESRICRQFDAKSLLILPINKDCLIKGVFEIFFNKPHVFDFQEVLAYRLLAGLTEDVLFREHKIGSRKKLPQFFPAASQPGGPESLFVDIDIAASARSDVPQSRKPEFGPCRLADDNRTSGELRAVPALRPDWFRRRWRTVAVASILINSVMLWITFHPDRKLLDAALAPAKPSIKQPISRPVPQEWDTDLRATARRAESYDKMGHSRFRRVRVGPTEVDYIADDVTIRTFEDSFSTARGVTNGKAVAIGDDVTVRYFNIGSNVVQAHPYGPERVPRSK